MIKSFENFLFKKKIKDIYSRAISNFNCLSHFTRISSKDLENDYHQLLKKYNIPYAGVISEMPKNKVDELNNDLMIILKNHNLKIESVEEIDDPRVGKEFWFEYHCNEGEDSRDYPMYLHSHQKCIILSIAEKGIGETEIERLENACQRVYHVKFKDGFEWSVFEDEILDSPKEYQRPDPPKKK